MNKQSQTKEQPNQPEYKDQPLSDTRSKKSQDVGFRGKEIKIVKSFKEMEMPN